jgi:uncharacterized membrane protein YphA (DoxX/SURF4 family)
MNVVLWIIQGLLAAVFIMAGWGKISSSVAQHIADGHIQPGDAVWPIRMLGVAEWLGCIGITVPWLTGILPILTPVAAAGFALIMAAGLVIHIRKKEYKMIPLLGAILLLAVVVAVGRFMPL